MDVLTKTADSVTSFIETFCKHHRGDLAGQTIELRPFQKEIINGLFETKQDGLWKNRHSLVMLPRKSGKSELLSAIGLWALLGSGEWAPEVYCVAGSKDQAKIVLDNVKNMIAAEEELSNALEVYKESIYCPLNSGVFRVLSSDGRLAHGLNPTFTIVDETWCHPDGELTEALLSGSGARKQSMVVHITTPGSGDDSYLWQLVEYDKRVKAGEIVDPTWWSWWQEPPADVDYLSVEAWRYHPAFGDWVTEEYLQSQALQLPEGEFRRLHLGQWTKSREQWITSEAFEACPNGDIEPGDEVVLAVDASFTNDSTVIVAATTDKRLKILEIWERPLDADESYRVPLNQVTQRLQELIEEYKPRACVYDPFALQHAMTEISDITGALLIEFPQSPKRMVPACSRFAELVLTRQLYHDHSPVLTRHIANCHTKSDRYGVRVTKEHRGSKRKIDAAVAAIMALEVAATLEPVIVPPTPKIF